MHAQALSQTRENLTQKHLASTRGAALLHNRIINLWNAPAAYIVTARSVSRFKRYLRNYANNTGTDFFYLSLLLAYGMHFLLLSIFWGGHY